MNYKAQLQQWKKPAMSEFKEEPCQHEWNETTSNGDKYRFFVCKHCDSTSNFEPLEVLEHEENHISPNCKVEDV